MKIYKISFVETVYEKMEEVVEAIAINYIPKSLPFIDISRGSRLDAFLRPCFLLFLTNQ